MLIKKLFGIIAMILILGQVVSPIVVYGEKSKELKTSQVGSTSCVDITADSYNEPQCSGTPVDFENSNFEESVELNSTDDATLPAKAVYDNGVNITDSDGSANDDIYTIDNKITNVQGDNQADSTLTYTFNHPVEVKSANIIFDDDTEVTPIDNSIITTNGNEVRIKVPQTPEEKNAKDFEVEMEVKSLDPIDTMQSISVTSEFDFSSEVEKAQDSEANSYSVIDSDEAEISLIPIKNIADVCKDESCDSGTAFAGGYPALSIKGIEYKINAQTNELMVQVAYNEEIRSESKEDVVMNVVDDSDNTVTIDSSEATELGQDEEGNYVYEYDTGELRSKLDQNGEYKINFKDNGETLAIPVSGGTEFDAINIEVPKTVEYDGKVYSEIGDGVNLATDFTDVSNADKVNPDTTDTYGIYELESIGYEEANSIDNTKIWDDTNDLTLTKYDHVIRPIGGNYIVADNIDGSVSKSETAADNAGGFGSDGYRPVGQEIGTSAGTDSLSFTGRITGDVDTILGSLEDDTYISNMYVNEPTLDNIGMISRADGADIDNLGIVDPSITGNNNVGSFIGTATNMSLENTYALESVQDDSSAPKYEIQGASNVGGLVGKGSQLSIKSTDNFAGEIPGIDLAGDVQPSNNPDKDGYKTFSTVDVKGTEDNIGGIVGVLTNEENEEEKIDKVYCKGSVNGNNNVGGITGTIPAHLTISNTYYGLGTSDDVFGVTGKENTGGIVGIGTATDTANSSTPSTAIIENSYNSGNVQETGDNITSSAGGLIGLSNSLTVENAYNTGEVSSNYTAGGIIGSKNDDYYLSLRNIYNIGSVEGKIIGGGIIGIGSAENAQESKNFLENILNAGEVSGTLHSSSIFGLGYLNSTSSNIYKLAGITTTPSDQDTYATKVSSTDISESNWWTDTLGYDSNWQKSDGVYPVLTESNDNSVVIPDQIITEIPVLLTQIGQIDDISPTTNTAAIKYQFSDPDNLQSSSTLEIYEGDGVTSGTPVTEQVIVPTEDYDTIQDTQVSDLEEETTYTAVIKCDGNIVKNPAGEEAEETFITKKAIDSVGNIESVTWNQGAAPTQLNVIYDYSAGTNAEDPEIVLDTGQSAEIEEGNLNSVAIEDIPETEVGSEYEITLQDSNGIISQKNITLQERNAAIYDPQITDTSITFKYLLAVGSGGTVADIVLYNSNVFKDYTVSYAVTPKTGEFDDLSPGTTYTIAIGDYVKDQFKPLYDLKGTPAMITFTTTDNGQEVSPKTNTSESVNSSKNSKKKEQAQIKYDSSKENVKEEKKENESSVDKITRSTKEQVDVGDTQKQASREIKANKSNEDLRLDLNKLYEELNDIGKEKIEGLIKYLQDKEKEDPKYIESHKEEIESLLKRITEMNKKGLNTDYDIKLSEKEKTALYDGLTSIKYKEVDKKEKKTNKEFVKEFNKNPESKEIVKEIVERLANKLEKDPQYLKENQKEIHKFIQHIKSLDEKELQSINWEKEYNNFLNK